MFAFELLVLIIPVYMIEQTSSWLVQLTYSSSSSQIIVTALLEWVSEHAAARAYTTPDSVVSYLNCT